MAVPSSTAKKRHRWSWVILGSLVLLIGGPLAWKFRPLNQLELRLVGTWYQHQYQTSDTSNNGIWTFFADRSYSTPMHFGSWAIINGRLRLEPTARRSNAHFSTSFDVSCKGDDIRLINFDDGYVASLGPPSYFPREE